MRDEARGSAEGDGAPYFLTADGAMARSMREHEWHRSPLGAPPQGWSPLLRTLVDLMLDAKQPMFVAWGPDLAFLYNDAYAPLLGLNHPAALGRPFAEVWAEIWAQIEPLVARTMAGEASFHEDLLIAMERHGHPEEAWFSFSFTPIRDETGDVAGMFCAATETTQAVLARRRIDDESRRLAQMFEQAPGFMAILSSPGHRIEMVNQAYLRLVGHREVVGRTVAEALPETVEQGYVGLLDGVYRSGERLVTTGARYSFRAEPGAPLLARIVDFVFQPLTDTEGRVTGIFIEGSDVTERTRAQDALLDAYEQAERQAAERAAILAHIAEGVVVTDAEGRITFVNEAATRLHGVARLDVAPEDYSETYHLFTEAGLPYPPQDLPLARAVRGETVREQRWRIRRADGREVLAIGAARPVRTADGRQIGAVLTLRDDTTREAAERRLREGEARLRALTDNLPSGMVYQLRTGADADAGGTGRRFLYVSQSHERLTGVPAEAVLADPEVRYRMILPAHLARLAEAEAASLREGRPIDLEVQFERADGALRWCRIISAPRPQDDGSVIWDGIQIDVTEQKAAEAHLEMLVGELNHRVKNSLAIVQAIAAQTFRHRESLDEARLDFTARIKSLANAHDVLTEANWAGASVGEIVRRTVEPHGGRDRFRIEGPEVAMSSKGALALSMALHELCTNAAKYGALSVEGGAVEIAWSLEPRSDARWLRMRWRESGGPPVAAPAAKGFGSRLIEYALAAELGGEVRLAYDPGGVTCLIEAPLPAPEAPDAMADGTPDAAAG